jgi:molybdate transport system substrate-binding protein
MLRTLARAALVASSLAAAQPERLTVSAASSVADAMGDIARAYRVATGVQVDVNTGGSNTLARQIVEGAPVDVFFSADAAQMDAVERAGRVVPGTRAIIVTNDLAVVVPTGVTRVAHVRDLTSSAVRRVAAGDPASVPAGVYARRWLDGLGLWGAVQPKVVPFPSVRAVLAAVAAGRADAGIVYVTDARTSTAVRTAIVVPTRGTAFAVAYPAAAVTGPREAAARRLLAYLKGPAARDVFARAGFGQP